MASRIQKLDYAVHAWSSFSVNYLPQNILVDNPYDQSCRWSSDSNNPPQFIILKLEAPAIVQTITFGKYEKTHVCNLKKFKLYGSLKEDCSIELLDSGLKNDHVPETFHIKNKIDGNYFPCQYIKIVPLQSWGTTFNFSIWYVELRGTCDPEVVNPSLSWYSQHREQEAIRLCLKHFRQHNYTEAFEALQKKTRVCLEHQLLTTLYDKLVRYGDYAASELLIQDAAKSGLFSHFISQQEFQPRWTKIEPACKEDGTEARPGRRGGHQMCLDWYSEIIYLFGGWDGKTDLADFWSYHMPTKEWICISANTEEDGGPNARSCHKMVLDAERKQLFILGRYVEPELRTPETLLSPFYMYDIAANKWILIMQDTFEMGGPRLLFDHQMVMDTERQTIYVFGGRILQSTQTDDRATSESGFSGLFSYHVPTNTWHKIRDDSADMKSRIGHSMLFHPAHKKLFIFAGQRGKEYLSDFFTYDVTTEEIQSLTDPGKKNNAGIPPAGFTQRATIDPDMDTIHVLLGLSKDKDKKESVRNSLWVFDIRKGEWACLYQQQQDGSGDDPLICRETEPIPRFAHQLVYDPTRKVHYMFGGNPGSPVEKKLRLDDFWSLQLCRPSEEHVVRCCTHLVRKYRFRELASTDSSSGMLMALRYLQTDLSAVVNHTDPKEVLEFQRLAGVLFESNPTGIPDRALLGVPEPYPHFHMRSELFDRLVAYFPASMTQPTGNLVDLLPLS